MSETSDLLNDAIAVLSQRGDSYGEASASFRRIADLWSNLYAAGRKIEPHEVAMHMICIKLSRLAESPGLRDNWLDIAGYAALGWECIIKLEKERLAGRSNEDGGQ